MLVDEPERDAGRHCWRGRRPAGFGPAAMVRRLDSSAQWSPRPTTPGRHRTPSAARLSRPARSASSIVCGGCGTVIAAVEPYPFRCPRAGDGGDHVLRRVLDVSRLEFSLERLGAEPVRALARPLSRLPPRHGPRHERRGLRRSRARPRRRGGQVDGHGFVVTPFAAAPALAVASRHGASIWVKDETGNVSGSHKARHLFGLLVHLEVVGRSA